MVNTILLIADTGFTLVSKSFLMRRAEIFHCLYLALGESMVVSLYSVSLNDLRLIQALNIDTYINMK